MCPPHSVRKLTPAKGSKGPLSLGNQPLFLEKTLNPWIETRSGRRVDLLKPTPEMIDIDDIAHALSNICRFNGHTRRSYSVAEHSVFVAMHVPQQLTLAGLLHDAAEAYIGDITRPLKLLIRELYGPIEAGFERAIGDKFNIDPQLFHHPDVVKADLLALSSEKRWLLPGAHNWEMELPEPVALDPSHHTLGQSYTLFMEMYRAYSR